MKHLPDIPYTLAAHPEQKLDLYLPDDAASFPLFLYFHGGGIESGDKAIEGVAKTLTDRGIAVASANYRMYPEARYPDFICDAAAACAWVKKHIGEYGSCEKIFVGGSSAGGYLSMMLCFDPKYLAPYGLKPTDFAGFIHDAGQPTTHFNVLRERGLDPRRVIVDEAAPLFYVTAETAGRVPPMLLIVSDNDIPARYEQTMLFMAQMKKTGFDMDKVQIKVMHGTHCAYCNAKDGHGDSILGLICCEYITKQLA